MGDLSVEVSTTYEVTPKERIAFWSELVTSYLCPFDFRYPRQEDFRGHTIRLQSMAYQLIVWGADEELVRRTPALVRRVPADRYLLVAPVRGTLRARQDGRETTLRAGTAGLFQLDARFDLWHSAGARVAVMSMTRDDLETRLGPATPRAAAYDLTTGLGKVVAGILVNVFRERRRLERREFDATLSRLVDLLGMLCLGDDRPRANDSRTEIVSAVRHQIRSRITDPRLSGRELAHSLGWSLRQVQLALRNVGTTPSELIRHERLRLVRSWLENPAYLDREIGKLALDAGFTSPSALSHAYRQHFGIPPKATRDATREASQEQ